MKNPLLWSCIAVEAWALMFPAVQGFEREMRDLPLVLFEEVLERVARLDRILSQPCGAALLCGRSGVGRRSALALVAFVHHMEVSSRRLLSQIGLFV